MNGTRINIPIPGPRGGSFSLRSQTWLYRGLWIGLLLGAAGLRFVGSDWDGGIAAHPDERFLLGAAEAVPLLHNVCRVVPEFPYGHLPLIPARILVLASPGADPLYAARLLSALVGVVLVALATAAGRRLAGRRAALFAGAIAAFSPGLIQQAHFYTVDPFGAALAGGAVLAASHRRWRCAGLLSGLAVACKVSLSVTVLVLLASLVWDVRRRMGFCPAGAGQASVARSWRCFLRAAWRFVWPAALAFLAVSPWSLLTPVACWRGPLVQSMLVSGRYVFPYTQQYAGTTPFVYPLMQMALWGLGPLVTLLGLGGLVACGMVAYRDRSWRALMRPAWLWTGGLFLATAGLAVKFPRYLLPLYPWWAAWAGYLLWGQADRCLRGWKAAITLLAIAGTVIPGWAQVSLYATPHPWDAASRWLVAHVAPGSTLVVEAWDHPLPVAGVEVYTQTSLPIYDDETPEKLEQLARAADADVIILASRRGYGALAREPARYAATLAWYHQQMHDRTIRVFTRCPAIGPLAITDDPLADAGLSVPLSLAERCGTRYALRLPRLDESLRVYDAPLTLVLAEDVE